MSRLEAMKVYAIDEDLPVMGSMVHYLSPDGLTLESEFMRPDGGNATSRVSWPNRTIAELNYEVARQAALKRVPRWDAAIEKLPVARQDVSRLRTLVRTRRGELTLYTNTGPPTWWLPDVSLLYKREFGIKAGWLRGCFVLSWRPRG